MAYPSLLRAIVAAPFQHAGRSAWSAKVRGWRRTGWMGVMLFGLAGSLSAWIDESRVWSEAELAGLERENFMWRQVRTTAEVDENVRRWEQAGCSTEEIARLMPQLQAMWANPITRQYGRISEETIARVKAVDATYLALLRMARLWQHTGVQGDGFKRITPIQVITQWRRAGLRALELNEIREFDFMNSGYAQGVLERTMDLPLSEDERRSLIEWEREFAVTHGHPTTWAGVGASERRWHEREHAALHDCVCELLGAERGAHYMIASHEPFRRMEAAVVELELSAEELIGLWKLRRKYSREIGAALGLANATRLRREASAHVEELLGAERFAEYRKLREARWLVVRVAENSKKK